MSIGADHGKSKISCNAFNGSERGLGLVVSVGLAVVVHCDYFAVSAFSSFPLAISISLPVSHLCRILISRAGFLQFLLLSQRS